ncbi:MAG: class I SAM-dependent methyltransferase [Desulfobacteraceae bacterium]|jgi:cyclopropane fatty-acyl-phospholipid synthase-like methyltransferase|nr:class I SAM-dependent methyltransferase [Desulfobacteraceae bacterium]
MEEQEKYIRALIELHRGLERQGPGDTDFSDYIISQLPELPTNPRIADIGCGTGAGTLFLADKFRSKVRAVDISRDFLDELDNRAKQRGLEHLVETIECDMKSLDWKPESIDLLWSEGAAYNLTFKGALKAWRPLMAPNGIAVISEIGYFTSEVPESLKVYWQNAYPAIGTESENSIHANSSGFKILGIHRLPSKAWWENYYGPLRDNMNFFKHSEDSIMQAVIKETEEEMKLFEEHEEQYGYSFYMMKAV